jgi:putative peptide zinc metalloprotease protein
MDSLAAQSVADSERPVPLKMRPDLVVRKRRYGGELYWVVREPIGLTSFRFHQEEYAILQMLDGQTNLEEIQRRFAQLFPPQRITLNELKKFLWVNVLDSGLVISETPHWGQRLFQRLRGRRRARWKFNLTHPLTINVLDLNPHRLLRACLPLWRKLVSPAGIVVSILLLLAAAVIIAVDTAVIWGRLPELHVLLDPGNWLGLAMAFALTMSLRELGKMLALKQLDGRCESGEIMLYAGIPCLKADLGQSWLIDGRRKRAAIAAAGFYVELFTGTIAALGWWGSSAGLWNSFCLNVTAVAFFGSLLNINPFLPGDGSRIVSVLTDTPMLLERARRRAIDVLAMFLCGWEDEDDAFLPRWKKTLLVFGAVGLVTQWTLTAAALWLVAWVLRPLNVAVFSFAPLLAAIVLLAIRPSWVFLRFLVTRGKMTKPAIRRLIAIAFLLGIALAAALSCPVPTYVRCSVTLEASEERIVQMPRSGAIRRVFVRPGETVEKDQPLFLVRFDTDADSERTRAHLDSSRVRAPSDGRIAFFHSVREDVIPGFLASPLQESWHLDQPILQGVALCRIVAPDELQAICTIEQKHFGLIAPQQPLQIRLNALPDMVWRADVDRVFVARTPARAKWENQQEFGISSEIALSSGVMAWHAQARVADRQGRLCPGLKGRGRILVGRDSLGVRLWRRLRGVLNSASY